MKKTHVIPFPKQKEHGALRRLTQLRSSLQAAQVCVIAARNRFRIAALNYEEANFRLSELSSVLRKEERRIQRVSKGAPNIDRTPPAA